MMQRVFTLLILILFCWGCNKKIDGVGPIVRTQKNVEHFTKIILETEGTLLIKQGAVQSVTIIAQQNIADALYTVVQNNRLKIYTDKWLTTDKDIVYEIVVPQITGMELAGSGKFKTTETIKTSKLDITVSGSGQMEVDVVTNELECDIMGSGNIAIKGSSNKTDLEISGSGAYHGFECYTANCDASISGSGLAEVSVSNSLKASVSGSGVINYTGKPKDVKKSISGSGAVNALN